MHIDEIKQRTNPFHYRNIVASGLSLMVLAWCWQSTEMSLGGLMDGWGNMVSYIAGNPELKDSGFFPPDLGGHNLQKYLLSMLETVQMAVLALILSILIAFPLAFLASRNTLAIIIPGQHRSALLVDKLRSYENHDVTTILIIIVLTVALIDRLSATIRTHFT